MIEKLTYLVAIELQAFNSAKLVPLTYRERFRSTDQLKERILQFVAYFNRTMAKPFKWTYKGKPLAV